MFDFWESEPPESVVYHEEPEGLKELNVNKKAWIKTQKTMNQKNTQAADIINFIRLDQNTTETEVSN